ncbi:hypothetical protein OG900_09290 [Streptomyces sp. NBC_00433]
MKLRNLRTAATASLGIAAAVAATVLAAPQAQAATTYWQFKALSTGTCLAAGTTGVVWAGTCSGSIYQQWDFINNPADSTGYDELKNRGTGLCLLTNNLNTVNGMAMQTCNGSTGEQFSYNGSSGAFTDWWGKNLRAESGGQVYAGTELAYWDGWHN